MKRIKLIIFIISLLSTNNIWGYNVYLSQATGNDSNDGKTAAKAVCSWEHAVDLLKTDGTSSDCIVMCSTYTVGKSISIDGNCGTWNAVVKRNTGFTGPIIDIYGSYIGVLKSEGVDYFTLTLTNITFSGEFVDGSTPKTALAPLIETSKIGSYGDYKPEFLIVLGNGATLRDNDRVTANSGSVSGGAIFLQNAKLHMLSGSSIINCKTTINGGGIWATTGSKSETYIKIDGGIIDGCSCYDNGGGICAYSYPDRAFGVVTVDLISGEIRNCIASGPNPATDNRGRGAGINCINSTILNITGKDMKIHDNRALKYGGGVQVQLNSILNLQNGEIYNNVVGNVNDPNIQTTVGAAGIHVTSAQMQMSGGKVHHNFTYGLGGGIHASYEGTITITGGEFSDNTAYMQGGAINLNTGTNLTVPEGTNVKMYGNKSSMGGAVMLDGATIKIYSGEYYDNKALVFDGIAEGLNYDKGYGGFACLSMQNYLPTKIEHAHPALFYIYGGSIHDNSADISGGGVYLKEKISGFPLQEIPSVNVFGGSFAKNKALNGDGGGFYIAEGNAYINNGSILSNTAGNNGGGFFVNKGNAIVSGGSIDGNGAKNGGAAYISVGSLELSGNVTSVTNNTASEKGGGFYVNGGSVTLNGSVLTGNRSTDGGGLYSNGGKLTYKQGSVISNEGTNKGGGLYVNGGIVEFDNGTLKDNKSVNGGGIYLGSGASMTFNDGLIAGNKALVGDLTPNFTTAYNGGNGTGNIVGCGGGIYLQSGASADKKTSLTINVVNTFGLYGNKADRAGDDIVAEGVNTSVTVPNVTSMDLKDFEGKDAQPNWYEDYVYIESGDIHDSGYPSHGILSDKNANSGKRFQQMLGSTDIDKHMITFSDKEKQYSNYVCLSLGYIVLNANIKVTGLHEKENMYFVVEYNQKKDDGSYETKNSYPVLVKGTSANIDQRMLRNLMPGYYTVKQIQTGATPWAWAYKVTDPSDGKYEYRELFEDGVNNVFEFTVKHVEDETNVMHDEELKANKMVEKK